jgi:hypothetical protein
MKTVISLNYFSKTQIWRSQNQNIVSQRRKDAINYLKEDNYFVKKCENFMVRIYTTKFKHLCH